MLKKFLTMALILALALLPAALAENGGGYVGDMRVVNCESWVSMRTGPSTSAARVTTVPLGALVTDCYYYTADFIHGEYMGMSGFILADYLTPAAAGMGDMVVVNCTDWVSLRAQPDTSAVRLTTVPLGAMVYGCSSAANGFIRCTYNGWTGYILSEYLSYGGDAGGEYLGDMVVVNCSDWVSLRAQPDTSAARLTTVPLGTMVYGCSRAANGFIRCTYNGWTGYILSEYLSYGEAAGSYVGGDMGDMVVVNCTDWVSLRSQPSTSSVRLTKVPLGAMVYGCSRAANGFVRCTYNGWSGYVLSQYLAYGEAYEPYDPVGEYLGDMTVVNCTDWVSLRAQPSTAATRLIKVPLGAKVTDCRRYNSRFTYGCYNGTYGYILSGYLASGAPTPSWSFTTPAPAEDVEPGDTWDVGWAGDYFVTASREYNSTGETLTVYCKYDDGTMNWKRDVFSKQVTELSGTEVFIGGTTMNPWVMLYSCDTGLSAVSAYSGETLWTVAPSTAWLGGSISWAVDDDGSVYVGGYYGPDPVAIGPDGSVRWQADCGSDDIFWLYEIELKSDGVYAHYDCMTGDGGTPGTVVYAYNGMKIAQFYD